MTIQFSELLIWDGIEYGMKTCPTIPENDPRFKVLNDNEIADVPFVKSTACWRNYFGSWSITNGRLYLDDVEGRYKIVCEKPVFADWYSGTLIIPRGEVIYQSTCRVIREEEVHLEIRNGVVTAETTLDNRQLDLDKVATSDDFVPNFIKKQLLSDDEMRKKPFWKFW